MPSGRIFSFQVVVGKDLVHEYSCKSEKATYIETDLNVPGVSFSKDEVIVARHGETEQQSWPVTPYQININVNRQPSDDWFWFDLYIDGAQVWNKPLRNGTQWTVNGTKDRKSGSVRELLFSLPRVQQDENDNIQSCRRSEIGSIVVVCTEAIRSGFRNVVFRKRDDSRRGQGLTERSDYHQANKNDCSAGGLLTTATGRELFRFTDEQVGSKMQVSFKRGRVLEELVVNYRMRQVLVDMGLIKEPKTNVDEVSKNFGLIDISSEKKNWKKTGKNVEETPIVKEEKKSHKTTDVKPIKTRVVEEIIEKTNEKGENVKYTRRIESLPLERYIRVDDDLFVVETLDDSVVILGDDDCVIVEPPVQEFPFVELE